MFKFNSDIINGTAKIIIEYTSVITMLRDWTLLNVKMKVINVY